MMHARRIPKLEEIERIRKKRAAGISWKELMRSHHMSIPMMRKYLKAK